MKEAQIIDQYESHIMCENISLICAEIIFANFVGLTDFLEDQFIIQLARSYRSIDSRNFYTCIENIQVQYH